MIVRKLSTECEESIVITIKFNESAEWFCTSSRSKWSQTQRTHRNTSLFMHWHSCCDHLPAGRKRQRRKAPPSNSFILMTVQMPLALERSYLDIKRSCKSNVSVFLFSLNWNILSHALLSVANQDRAIMTTGVTLISFVFNKAAVAFGFYQSGHNRS